MENRRLGVGETGTGETGDGKVRGRSVTLAVVRTGEKVGGDGMHWE